MDFVRRSLSPPHDAHRSISPLPVALRVIVAVAEGVSHTLDVYVGENPEDAALRFLQDHALPAHALQPLTQHIAANIQKLHDSQRCAVVKRVPQEALDAKSSSLPRSTNNKTLLDPNKPRICRKSQQLMLGLTGTPVQERLHAWQQEKNERAEERARQRRGPLAPMEMNSSPTTVAPVKVSQPKKVMIVPSDRMYQAARRQQERLTQARESGLAERLQEEMKEAFFKPRITALARHSKSRGVFAHGHGPVHAAKQRVLADEADVRLMKECTFQPSVNRNYAPARRSSSAGSVALPGPRWSALYSDSERRKLSHDLRQK